MTNHPPELVEAMARGMYANAQKRRMNLTDKPLPEDPWEAQVQSRRASWISDAQAALQAIQAEGMVLAKPNAIGAAELAVGQWVYRRIEKLMDAKVGTPQGEELSYLAQVAAVVEEYGAQGDEDDQ